ncbi:hypothetical protein [Acetobacter cibinongensis]|nr:hypothetical protein [Acetobacter cibinongensis]
MTMFITLLNTNFALVVDYASTAAMFAFLPAVAALMLATVTSDRLA